MRRELFATNFVREIDSIKQSLSIITRSGDETERKEASGILCEVLDSSVYAGGKKSWNKVSTALHRLGSAVYTNNIYKRLFRVDLFCISLYRLAMFEKRCIKKKKK